MLVPEGDAFFPRSLTLNWFGEIRSCLTVELSLAVDELCEEETEAGVCEEAGTGVLVGEAVSAGINPVWQIFPPLQDIFLPSFFAT